MKKLKKSVDDVVKTSYEGEYGETYVGENSNPKEELEKELKSNNLHMELIAMPFEKEIQIYEKCKVLIPVIENTWEILHSTIIPSRNISIPNKQISISLDLCSQPQTFNLFEKNGSLASITIQYYKKTNFQQNLTYLRKDLLDQYLLDNGLKFIWAIWGGKEYYPEDESKIFKRKEFETERQFSNLVKYEL